MHITAEPVQLGNHHRPFAFACIHALIVHARSNDRAAFANKAQHFCDQIVIWKETRFQIPTPVDDGLAISTIVKHKPRKHPSTTRPREFDTLFFAALFLLELAGMRVTFQWLAGKYYLRGEISSGAGQRCYAARIILDAEPSRRARFDDDHHSYRLRDLMQRAGAGGLPPGKHGRQNAIDRCHVNYAKNMTQYHADLSPDELAALLSRLLKAATTFHADTPMD